MSAVEHITGTGVSILGNDIDTDRIVPARFLKDITFEKMGEYLFYDVRFDESGNTLDFPLNDERFAKASIMIVGRNFGCGSSREHAAQAIKRYGIQAVIGESFGEIFAGNCQSLGIPACMLSAEKIAYLQEYIDKHPAEEIQIDMHAATIAVADKSFGFCMDDARRQSFTTGSWDAVAMLLANQEKVAATAARLPYINN